MWGLVVLPKKGGMVARDMQGLVEHNQMLQGEEENLWRLQMGIRKRRTVSIWMG